MCAAAMVDSASILEISLSESHRNNANQMGYAFCAANSSVFIFRSSLFTGDRGFSGSMNLLNSTGYLKNCTLKGKRRKKYWNCFNFNI